MPLISLRKSSREAEQDLTPRSVAEECYVAALDNLAQYAIELEETTTKAYQGYLKDLAREVEGGTPQALAESQGTLRGLLRDYKDRAAAYISSLREELSRTASGLQRLIETLTQSDGNHESRLMAAVKQLRELAQSPMAKPVAEALRAASDSIAEELEKFREQQQLTVSQLLAEISLLHRRIDALESASSAEDLTKLFSRQEMERRLRVTVAGGALVLIKVDGLKRAALQFNADVARQLAAAFVKRLRNNLKPGAVVGRWSEEGFLIHLPASCGETEEIAKWIREHVAGSYACLLGGKIVRPAVQATVEVIHAISGGSAMEQIIGRIGEYFDPQAG
ncbi:MAG TPA: diguanylate cyclase [Bryobacteraceae bacterium]|nr:diguanylate cyclase [Bryobacteraceae bacterium]